MSRKNKFEPKNEKNKNVYKNNTLELNFLNIALIVTPKCVIKLHQYVLTTHNMNTMR